MQKQKEYTVLSTDFDPLISENSASHFLIIVVKTCTSSKHIEESDIKRDGNKNN